MNERFLAVDILRGVILLGVSIVNAITINGTYYLDTVDFAFKLHWFDHISSSVVSIFFLEKFYPLFVFLFGVSNQIFLSRLLKQYQTHYSSYNLAKNKLLLVFFKRMSILAIFGFAHLSLFFWGDVLLIYAILGMALVLIINNICDYNYKKITSLAVFLIILITAMGFINKTLIKHSGKYDNYSDYYANAVIDNNDTLKDYSNSYTDRILSNNIKINLESYYKLYIYGTFKSFDLILFIDNISYILELFTLMLLGSLVASLPDWHNKILFINNNILRRTVVLALPLYIISESNILGVYDIMEYINILLLLNNITLYLILYLLLFKSISKIKKFEKILSKFSAIGKMTLTWYLLMSITMSLVLYDYGFGLFSKICVTDCIVIALIFYIIAYQTSHIWIRKHSQGPVEKIWRRLTIPNVQYLRQ